MRFIRFFKAAHSTLFATAIQIIHRTVQSVGATGGVYKGQTNDLHVSSAANLNQSFPEIRSSQA